MSAEQREGWGGRGGLVWDHWSWLKHESRRPTLPISCLRFISILPCYFCSLKASDESLATDKCLCLLVFYGPQMIDFIRPPLSFIPFSFFFCSIPVSALRCHKRSYSLWFTLRFLRDGLGTPERTMLLLVLLKEWIFTRHQRKGMRDCELLTILHLYLLCKK